METQEEKREEKNEQKNLNWFDSVHNWYARFERPLSSLSLIGGFVFDALTLKRVDLFWENFWVVIHLSVVAIAIILINREEVKGPIDGYDKKAPSKFHFWLRNILQFAFGGLLSTYLVFYFRSGALSVSWPFLLMLALAFVANEALKKHFSRMSFQIAFFFLSLYSFAIFLLPVLLHQIGPWIFILSGVASLVAVAVFILILRLFTGDRSRKAGRFIWTPIFVILIAMNVLYFFNLIPPIPLSLKDAGVFHSITRNADGNYVVETEAQTGVTAWLSSHWSFDMSSISAFFNVDETVTVVPGADTPLYVYSAVFSPAYFATDIIHQWQYYDTTTKAWVTTDEVTLPVNGGRDGGYRTYSLKTGVTPGSWRVNVETPQGQIIGRLNFTVVAAPALPALETEIKE